jgi:hypothetical protein
LVASFVLDATGGGGELNGPSPIQKKRPQRGAGGQLH